MPIIEDWHCSGCDETVPSHFDVCWNCGTDRAGNPDSSFVPAVGFTPECRWCGYLLYGLPTLVCPECGTPFDPTEKDTIRQVPEPT